MSTVGGFEMEINTEFVGEMRALTEVGGGRRLLKERVQVLWGHKVIESAPDCHAALQARAFRLRMTVHRRVCNQ